MQIQKATKEGQLSLLGIVWIRTEDASAAEANHVGGESDNGIAVGQMTRISRLFMVRITGSDVA